MEQFRAFFRTLAVRVAALPHLVRYALISAFVLILLLCLCWHVFIRAPKGFPTDSLVLVETGTPAVSLARQLQEQDVVRSALMFEGFMRLTGADREIHAGTYYFAQPLNVFEVASRIRHGERGIESIRVTLTEGMTSWEMANTLSAALPDFSSEEFEVLAAPYEGYLFPDTYFIDPGTQPGEVLARLRDTFAKKTEALAQQALEKDVEFSDAVTLASLLEKEADTPEDLRIVSGILANRLEEGMPLQVDAVFGYILKRSGYAPTGKDLDIESPYNTYRNRGLPPGPIANPGLAAIEAALNPADTPYFYYLTGRDGKMYYARTFEEHKRNRGLYLD